MKFNKCNNPSSNMLYEYAPIINATPNIALFCKSDGNYKLIIQLQSIKRAESLFSYSNYTALEIHFYLRALVIYLSIKTVSRGQEKNEETSLPHIKDLVLHLYSPF